MADDSVLKVVELFVDNINEANKNVTKDLDKINDSMNDLNTKMSTPPRHQELEADHKDLDEKVTLIISSLVSIEDAVKNGIRTIKIVAGVFGISILIAASVITYFNTKQINIPKQTIIKKELVMEKRLDKLEAMWLKFLTEHIKKEGEKH